MLFKILIMNLSIPDIKINFKVFIIINTMLCSIWRFIFETFIVMVYFSLLTYNSINESATEAD